MLEDDDAEDAEDAERVESNEERGETSADWKGVVWDMSDSSTASSCSCQNRLDRASPLPKIWGSCRSSENWNMIADAFLRLRTTSRLFNSRNHVVGQGYQGNVFISQVNAREEMRSESGNGTSSSLWNLSRSSR